MHGSTVTCHATTPARRTAPLSPCCCAPSPLLLSSSPLCWRVCCRMCPSVAPGWMGAGRGASHRSHAQRRSRPVHCSPAGSSGSSSSSSKSVRVRVWKGGGGKIHRGGWVMFKGAGTCIQCANAPLTQVSHHGLAQKVHEQVQMQSCLHTCAPPCLAYSVPMPPPCLAYSVPMPPPVLHTVCRCPPPPPCPLSCARYVCDPPPKLHLHHPLLTMGSPKKSMSRCTTLEATSGNLTAQLWMAATSICRAANQEGTQHSTGGHGDVGTATQQGHSTAQVSIGHGRHSTAQQDPPMFLLHSATPVVP
jgi:hypothetical protein